LTGDDGASAVVTVAVVEADLPGPPAQRGLHSPYYPGQLCSCPTLYTEIHSLKKELHWIGQKVLQKMLSFILLGLGAFNKYWICTKRPCVRCKVTLKVKINLLTKT